MDEKCWAAVAIFAGAYFIGMLWLWAASGDEDRPPAPKTPKVRSPAGKELRWWGVELAIGLLSILAMGWMVSGPIDVHIKDQ